MALKRREAPSTSPSRRLYITTPVSLAHDSGLPPRRRPCAATSTPLRRALHHYTNLAVDFVHYTDSMANNAEASGLRISPLSL